jgi:hypothetical protein
MFATATSPFYDAASGIKHQQYRTGTCENNVFQFKMRLKQEFGNILRMKTSTRIFFTTHIFFLQNEKVTNNCIKNKLNSRAMAFLPWEEGEGGIQSLLTSYLC